MKLSGSYEINAPRERVWGVLTQPASLQGCIPGCQRLEDVGDSNYEASISAQMGPIRGNFNARVSIKDWNPHESYRMVVSANGPPRLHQRRGLRHLDRRRRSHHRLG